MFKGTNKVWKGLALALALCMLPTVALAADTLNGVRVVLDTEVKENVKVTVTIGDKDTPTDFKADTDVTILALRRSKEDVAPTEAELEVVRNAADAEHLPVIPTATDALKAAVTYIDQETSDENGNVTFEFIPASTTNDAKYIDVYIGGENVDAVKVITLERALAAPTLTLADNYKWMAGDGIVLSLGGSVAADEDALAAWAADVTAKFTVSAGEAIADVADVETWTIADGELVIPYNVVAGRTITGITFESDSYTNKAVDGIPAAGLKEELKTAGTLANADIIAGNAIALALTDNAAEEWVADLNTALTKVEANANDFITVKAGNDTVTIEGASVSEGKLVLTGAGLAAGTDGTTTYTVKVAVPFYNESNTANLVISTAAYKDAAELKTSYAPTYAEPILSDEAGNLATPGAPTTEEIKMYGTATVTFPAVGTNGTAITWEATGDNAADVEGTSPTFTLPRLASTDASDAKNTVYTFAAMVGDIAVENITVTVSKCGTALSIEEANVSIIKADAYGMTGKTLISVVGPEDFSGSMSIDGVKLFYAPAKAKYYGVVNSEFAATTADVVSNVEFDEAGSSENLYFGVAIDETDKVALNGRDFLLSVRLNKNKLTESDVVNEKTYIALDVADVELDGEFNGRDFLAMVRGNKGTQLPVLGTAE